MKPLGRRRAIKKKTDSDRALDKKRALVARCIRSLPVGTVSSYGAIACAAGWPGAARQVARVLRQTQGLPWYRVVGSGGAIKTTGEGAAEQRFRLRMEGVSFRGARVDMKKHEFKFNGKGKGNKAKASKAKKASRQRRSS